MTRRPSRSTLLVLEVLKDGPSHGYEIMQRTALKSGTLYPILIRMTERGLVTAEWVPSEQPGRPPRHVYTLSRQGLAYLHDSLQDARSRSAGAAKALKS